MSRTSEPRVLASKTTKTEIALSKEHVEAAIWAYLPTLLGVDTMSGIPSQSKHVSFRIEEYQDTVSRFAGVDITFNSVETFG